jgi:hypothetical protein
MTTASSHATHEIAISNLLPHAAVSVVDGAAGHRHRGVELDARVGVRDGCLPVARAAQASAEPLLHCATSDSRRTPKAVVAMFCDRLMRRK